MFRSVYYAFINQKIWFGEKKLHQDYFYIIDFDVVNK